MIAGGVTLSVIVSPVVAAVTVGQSSPLHPSPSSLSLFPLPGLLPGGQERKAPECDQSFGGGGHLPSSSGASLIQSALLLVVVTLHFLPSGQAPALTGRQRFYI